MVYITFEESKEMLKKSINETTNLNEALEKTVQLLYLRGYEDSKNDVLDKIRAEILDCLKVLDDIGNVYLPNEIAGRKATYQQCLEFIDKYKKAESEE